MDITEELESLVKQSATLTADLIDKHGMTEGVLLMTLALSRIMRMSNLDEDTTLDKLGAVLTGMWFKEREGRAK